MESDRSHRPRSRDLGTLCSPPPGPQGAGVEAWEGEIPVSQPSLPFVSVHTLARHPQTDSRACVCARAGPRRPTPVHTSACPQPDTQRGQRGAAEAPGTGPVTGQVPAPSLPPAAQRPRAPWLGKRDPSESWWVCGREVSVTPSHFQRGFLQSKSTKTKFRVSEPHSWPVTKVSISSSLT